MVIRSIEVRNVRKSEHGKSAMQYVPVKSFLLQTDDLRLTGNGWPL